MPWIAALLKAQIMLCFLVHNTPLGAITLEEESGALTALHFGIARCNNALPEKTSLLMTAARELDEYFSGKRHYFDLPLNPSGTPFQLRCWEVLCRIPYGDTISYGEEAVLLGNPKACRAVGMANHRNPLPILIPCHRVIGKNGQMTGYGGGIAIKEYLLRHEAFWKGRTSYG